MWTSWVKAGIALVALPFLMWVLWTILNPLIDVAMAGDHSDAETVQQVGGYLNALTLENLTLIAMLAIGFYLIGRAAVEGQLTR